MCPARIFLARKMSVLPSSSRTHRRAGSSFEPLDLAVPVGVVVQHRDAALLGHDLDQFLHVGPHEAVPQPRREELRRRAPAAHPVADGLPDRAHDLAGLLALLGHDDVQDGLHLVGHLEEVEGELLDRAAPGQVLERDGRRSGARRRRSPSSCTPWSSGGRPPGEPGRPRRPRPGTCRCTLRTRRSSPSPGCLS